MKKLTWFLLVPAFALLLASTPSMAENPAPASSERYVIGPEDVLEIAVWRNTELSKVVTVRPDGKISLPLVGELKASGLTPEELRVSIVERLKEFQQTVVASVIVQSVNSYRIYILGEVRLPGTYVLKTNTSVLQAISLAGGFSQFSSKNKIIVIRKSAGGADEKLTFRLDDLISAKDGAMDPILKPGDTIFVQ